MMFMIHVFPRSIRVPWTLLCLVLAFSARGADLGSAGGDESGGAPAEAQNSETATAPRDDVIARVGDQPVTFSQLNTMLNSSAIVGVSIPTLGSPERDQVRLTLLDKIISANLLYLDALQQGEGKDPAYQRELKRFSDAMLIALYRQVHLVGNIDVTDEEVKAFFENNIAPGTEFTEELRLSIEAKLRKRKLVEATTSQRERLREGVKVTINVTELDPGEDALREDAEVVAEWGGEVITWGEVKQSLALPHSLSAEQRIGVLDDIIDNRIMARKGRDAGLEQTRVYQVRYNEYRKVRLINIHRGNLIKKFQPTDEQIREYYARHRDQIWMPARRKVQIVVLETREDAEAIKQLLEAGTITMYQAAAEHSILPGADKTLGELGWVNEGSSAFPELNALTFSLGPGEIGGPVETPNGWHLVKVQDVEEALYDDIKDQRTERMTRRMILKERLNEYVVGLREKTFPVEVYDDKLSYHMQKEIDWYQIKAETGTQPPEKIYEEIEKLRGGRAPSLGH